jgi:TRAP-type transport system large permease protein
MTVAVFIFSLMGAMALGMPIAYSLLVCGVALMAFLASNGTLASFDAQILAQRFVDGADNFPLLAVPFFLLAGEFMNAGGLSKRIVNLGVAWVGLPVWLRCRRHSGAGGHFDPYDACCWL